MTVYNGQVITADQLSALDDEQFHVLWRQMDEMRARREAQKPLREAQEQYGPLIEAAWQARRALRDAEQASREADRALQAVLDAGASKDIQLEVNPDAATQEEYIRVKVSQPKARKKQKLEASGERKATVPFDDWALPLAGEKLRIRPYDGADHIYAIYKEKGVIEELQEGEATSQYTDPQKWMQAVYKRAIAEGRRKKKAQGSAAVVVEVNYNGDWHKLYEVQEMLLATDSAGGDGSVEPIQPDALPTAPSAQAALLRPAPYRDEDAQGIIGPDIVEHSEAGDLDFTVEDPVMLAQRDDDVEDDAELQGRLVLNISTVEELPLIEQDQLTTELPAQKVES